MIPKSLTIYASFIRQVGLFKWATRYVHLQLRKRLFKRDSQLRLPTGSVMVLPRHSRSSTEVFVTDANIDWGSEALFARFADPARDFIDIGAHVGYYSCYLSPRVRCAYAFEPDPRNVPSLRNNALRATNIEVIEAAVSSRNGVASFAMAASSELSSLQGIERSAAVQVTVTTIDAFVAAHPKVDAALIKTDVEGHDLDALQGMHAVVALQQPLILSECSCTHELCDLCFRWDYKIFAFTRQQLAAKARLREVVGLDSHQPLYKMLFLVPPRLASIFCELVASGSL